MENLVLSNNGKYLIGNDRIYIADENKSYSINEISISKWINILSENTTFSIKNKMVNILDLASYHRRVTYQLMESFPFVLKSKLMLEYETKFGNKLLLENSILIENWFSDAWNWTADKVAGASNWIVNKVKGYGEFAVKTGGDFVNCITGKGCSPLFEDFREMLFSPEGIAVETFLSISGIGTVAPIVAWGIMLCWDINLLITNDPSFSWLNLIYDVLGVGLGTLAKGARIAFEAAGFTKTAGMSITELISKATSNPKTAVILKQFGEIATKSLNNIMSAAQTAGKFLSEKLGLKWIDNALRSMSEQIGKIVQSLGFKGETEALQSGIHSGVKQGGIAAGVNTVTGTATSFYNDIKNIITSPTVKPSFNNIDL